MRILFIIFLIFFTVNLSADDNSSDPVKIGYIGSLSGFASSFGKAVLDGAKLAVKEINQAGEEVQLVVEDDQSATKNTVTAYSKLYNVDKIQGLIGGSWWINSVVKQSERNKVPLVSCETLYNKDVVKGENYFLLQGYLKEWVRVYQPLLAEKQLKRGAIIRFVSGFAETLEDEMRNLFSVDGRQFVGSVTYSDVMAADIASLVIELKKLKPEVLYIDAQPAGFVNILTKLRSAGMHDLTVITHSSGADALRENLLPDNLKDFYYTERSTFHPDFKKKFLKEYSYEPYLNADLGYYALHLLYEAIKSGQPVEYLASLRKEIDGVYFSFDANNVNNHLKQQVWQVTPDANQPVLVN